MPKMLYYSYYFDALYIGLCHPLQIHRAVYTCFGTVWPFWCRCAIKLWYHHQPSLTVNKQQLLPVLLLQGSAKNCPKCWGGLISLVYCQVLKWSTDWSSCPYYPDCPYFFLKTGFTVVTNVKWFQVIVRNNNVTRHVWAKALEAARIGWAGNSCHGTAPEVAGSEHVLRLIFRDSLNIVAPLPGQLGRRLTTFHSWDSNREINHK